MILARKWVGYVLLAVMDGLGAACLAVLAFLFPLGQGVEPPVSFIETAGRMLLGPVDVFRLAAFGAGSACAFGFVHVLGRLRYRSTLRFMTISVLAGIAYGFVTAVATMALFVPLSILRSQGEMSLFSLLVGTLVWMYAAMFASIMMAVIVYGLVIVVGGSLLGLLNGLLLRWLWKEQGPSDRGLVSPGPCQDLSLSARQRAGRTGHSK